MIKPLIVSLLSLSILFSSAIDTKIDSNKKKLEDSIKVKEDKNQKIKKFAKEIKKQTNSLQKLEDEIDKVNRNILAHKDRLRKSKRELRNLQKSADELKVDKKKTEEEIVDIIIEEFSSSIALNITKQESTDRIFDNEIYSLLARNSKDELLRLDTNYMLVTQNKKENKKRIAQTRKFIKINEEKKRRLNRLKIEQRKVISLLEKKHKAYQDQLKKAVQEQNSLTDLLANLNILKKVELAKKRAKEEQERKRLLALFKQERKKKIKEEAKKKREIKAKQKKAKKKNQVVTIPKKKVEERFNEKVDIDVRMLGSSTKGVKIAKYRGKKTIAPLKKYTITKKFGKYLDPIYKIQLFHESIVLKTKTPNAKVYAILKGKVVYAKKNSGMLENVVIIQHKNGLHTIYSHLDQISPTLKVGKWVKKGYVVGRVNNSLTFQAVKNNAHINPETLFK